MDPTSISLETPSLIGAFFGGLIATLTPCVYPLIPITLSIVGAGKESSRPKALFRSILFCGGIFLSYALLGILAVASGSFFGDIWSMPSFRTGLGIAISGYALISLDLVFFKSEGRLTQAAARLSGNSPYGAFAAGAVSGILAAPCTGALLATILTFAATSSNAVAGIFLLLSYAAGFAAPFFLLSLSPQAFSFIPRSGVWLYGAKFLIGAALLSLGIYYLFGNYISDYMLNFKAMKLTLLSITFFVIIVSCYLGVRSYILESKILRFFSAAAFALMLIPFVLNTFNLSTSRINDSAVFASSLARAQSRGVPLVLEFTADWCVKCKELARDVFSKKEVIDELTKTEFVTVDLSNLSEQEKALQKQYGVRGLPLIMFLCPSGEELKIPRINEVLNSSAFLDRLESAKLKFGECVTKKVT